MNLRSARGFSLVELMIVVAIIGILAAIAIPNFQRFQAKSRQAEARANLSAIYAAQKAFNAEWQQFFGDLVETGYRPEGAFRYEHGFNMSTVTSPNNYTGLLGASMAAVNLSTVTGAAAAPSSLCVADLLAANIAASAAGMCGVDRTYNGGASMLPALAAAADVAAANDFFALAVGNIDDDAGVDVWGIDENKAISGPGNAQADPVVANGGDLDN